MVLGEFLVCNSKTILMGIEWNRFVLQIEILKSEGSKMITLSKF